MLTAECAECGLQGARQRRCTASLPLCAACRLMPQHKIVTQAAVRKVLSKSELKDLGIAGRVFNPTNPAFRPMSVYYARDVAAVLVKAGREIPDLFM